MAKKKTLGPLKYYRPKYFGTYKKTGHQDQEWTIWSQVVYTPSYAIDRL